MKQKKIRNVLVAVLLAAALVFAAVFYLWGPAIFQRGNPIPYLRAALQLSEEQPYVLVGGDAVEVYITRRGDCEALFSMIEDTRKVTLVEQMGSAWVFCGAREGTEGTDFLYRGTDRLTVSSEIYWGKYTVWLVPYLVIATP